MRRISRVVSSSARGTAVNRSTRAAAAIFSRGYAAPNTPQTDFKVTDTGIRVYAHGVEHDMNFLGDLPADAREVLSGREWVPQSIADFAARWEKEAPQLVQQAREIESLIEKSARESPVKFGKSEAYLRDIAVQTALERASVRGVTPIELAIAHFWSAYSEVPSGGKAREPAPTHLERAKALLQNKTDPQFSVDQSRARKGAAVAQYVNAKSVDSKAAAAYILLGAEKASALKAALQGANDAAKEQIIKQHLQWDEATKAAADLTQRHPEFTELKEVLAHFPPLVHHIGEPSVAHYKFKHLADKAFKKWQETNTLTSVTEITEKDPLLKNLRELVTIGKSTSIDAKQAQALQRAFPSLLFSRDAESFSAYLKQDEGVQSQAGSLFQQNLSEYPNDPALTHIKDIEKRTQLWEQHSKEIAEVQHQWIDSKLAFIDNKIQEGMVQMDKFVNGTVDDILADHPEWEKQIEDDIENHRWDPEMEKKEFDHALQHYYEHHTVHA